MILNGFEGRLDMLLTTINRLSTIVFDWLRGESGFWVSVSHGVEPDDINRDIQNILWFVLSLSNRDGKFFHIPIHLVV